MLPVAHSPQHLAFMLRYARMLPVLVGAMCLLLTALSLISVHRMEERMARQDMHTRAMNIAAALQQRTAAYVALLQSLATYVELSGDVDGAHFNRFVESLELETTYRGAMGIGWSVAIPKGQEQALAAYARDQGQAGYHMWPNRPTPGPYTHAVLYVAPLTVRTRSALGYNMYTEESRRQAMDIAARSGEATATGPVHLISNGGVDEQAGFLIYVPVYGSLSGTAGPKERQAALRGFVYSPFQMAEFLQSSLNLAALSPYHVTITDMEAAARGGDRGLLFTNNNHNARADVEVERIVTIANRRWVITLRDSGSATLSALSTAILGMGLLVSLMAAIATVMVVRRFQVTSAALQALQEQESIRRVLTRELTHRVKNSLATVLSLASLTRSNVTDLDDYLTRFTARVRALSATQDILVQADWRYASLKEVVQAELAPYLIGEEDRRVTIIGEDVFLLPNIAMSVGLALHELATNAAKYGALSVPKGRLCVRWSRMAGQDAVTLDWIEEGGPKVTRPEQRGFGSRLIERVIAQELNYAIRIDFRAEGVRCRFPIPFVTDPALTAGA